jgi:branched-chain amino acid transport system permease protein
MATFVTVTLIGLGLGCIYGIIGLSLTAIFNATRVINFAQGDLAMVGALMGFVAFSQLSLPFPIAILVLILSTVAASVGIQHLMVNPLLHRGAKPVSMIMVTLSGALILEGIFGAWLGYGVIRTQPPLGFSPWVVGDMILGRQYIIIIATTLVLSLAYWWFLKRTMVGRALSATGYNIRGARGIGIPVARMVTLSFVISGIIAGVAGYLVGPITGARALMGLPLLVNGFIAAIIGGIGNPYAAVVGGLVLGLTTSYVTGYLSAASAEFSALGMMFLVLLVRPRGLFGTAIK